MPFEFRLPDIGEGIHEGEIVKWLVKEGDFVREDQPMVEVMTDKATVEIPAPRAGKILKLHAQEGEVVKVGSVLVTIEEIGEAKPEPKREAAVTPSPPPKPEPEPIAVASASAATVTAPPAEATSAQRVLATPATRKLARELGVDIAQIRGTGPGGRITDEDVRRFAAARMAPPPPPPAPTPAPPPQPTAPAFTPSPVVSDRREERIPLRGIRKRIAEHMRQSKSTAAHFTYVDEVDMTELIQLREQIKPLAEQKGVKLTYLPFIVKASVAALKEMPILNASIDEATGEIVIKKYYNIGIATATEEGLIVPVIKDADRKSILEIAAEIERLAKAAREGKIALQDIQGGTFTITSLGALGGLFATPIINYPEVAILGIHEIKKRPVVRENQIVIRDIMYISLSFDHRLIDGDVGARFCKKIIGYLEDPKLLFLESV
ncbi:MAG: 2-oxo acid dehydrogenase subunit E2 [Candidatus Bipolaricaulota bacterium]|nr:2-oxo acid dehydrogenase subunit E2 [Candidatus Bipolaricaulota bacterium]MDW8031026.1 dihydrolipoamide acetyltransferase family protein [Candidatus Bipolaricaulota bacterium]